ncbi:MAG: tetratricopeptide repeat protein, partial [Cyanobacteriota bacterium]|nr:tetratricopeptide repeat protein [Cyanobacteriota bacterium]
MKNIWQSLFKPQTPESEAESRVVPKPYKPLSDADYEYLFDQLLEGIAYGWQPGRIQRFFETLGDRGQQEPWLSWLERYELRAMTAPTSNADLAQRLVKLGEQCQALSEPSTARKVGDRARDLGMRLLYRGTLNEIWEYAGPDATATLPSRESPTPPQENLIPSLPVENAPSAASQLPPPPTLDLAVQDLSWEELLVSLQQNPDFLEQVTQELGLETTNLQAAIAAIAQQVQLHQQSAETVVEDAETWFNRGVERYEVEDFAAALSYWERAIELQPHYYQAWNNRGLALKQLGRIQEGLDCYGRALEIEPTYYKAWYNQGIVLEELKHFDLAIPSYDKAIEFKPDYYKAWSSRGDALREKGDYEGAIASYDKAIELKVDLADVWYARGLALAQLAQIPAAIASYDKAIALKAELPHVWSARGSALAQTGAWEEAIASFDKALQLKADAWDTWLARSRAARLSPAPDLLLTSLSAIAANASSLNQR